MKSIIIFFITITFFIGCSNKEAQDTSGSHSEKEEHKEEPTEENGHVEDEIVLTEEQIRITGMEFSKIENRNISGYIKVNGEIMMDQDSESKVGSIIPGRVKKIYVKEGSYVRAGQTLAVIENPDLINVQIEYINAKNDFEFAKLEYDRQQKLSRDNIGSKKNLAGLESNYRRALANYKTLEEKLSGYKISKDRFDNIYTDTVADLQRNYTVTAPISGNVISRMISIGQYVEQSTDMFHIVNTNTVYADLSIFENALSYVKPGQRVDIETSSNPDEVFEGTVSFVNKVFDDKNRTVKVRVKINNRSQKLYPYMFISAKIYINDGEVPSVPLSSIETDGESKYVFVKTTGKKKVEEQENKDHTDHDEHESDEHDPGSEDVHKTEIGIIFKKYRVNTGISDDNYIEIIPLENPDPEDEVVSKGAFYLKSELMKEELSGHEH